MVAGLKFLSKKSFNPQNLTNQKTVWERQQQKQAETKRLKEREDQLKRERDEEELARARHGQRGGDLQQLKFMYDVPATTTTTNEEEEEEEEEQTSASPVAAPSVATRQPGDDDAAAAFRQMLAAAAATSSSSNEQSLQESTTTLAKEQEEGTVFSDNKGAALSGTSIEKELKKKELSALEKAVGRRDGNNSSGLTLEEQIARFPQLKNAPMAKGMTSTNVNVTFKPLGTQLRNTRCFACGVWGHSKGDRECLKSGWDPFSSSTTTSSINRPSITAGQEKATGEMSGANVDNKEYSDKAEKRNATRRLFQ